MATTTVRLDSEDERILDGLAATYGGRSNTIRQALRLLWAKAERQRAMASFLDEWADEPGSAGPVDPDAVAEMVERYQL